MLARNLAKQAHEKQYGIRANLYVPILPNNLYFTSLAVTLLLRKKKSNVVMVGIYRVGSPLSPP